MSTDEELRNWVHGASNWLLVPAYLLLFGWASFWGSWGGWGSWGQCLYASAFLIGVPWLLIALCLIAFNYRRWKAVVHLAALLAAVFIFITPYLPERRFIDAYESVRIGSTEAEIVRIMEPVSNVEPVTKPTEFERMFGWNNDEGTTEDYASFSMIDGVVVKKDIQFED
ncbi:MAG TPA: hypothetical protein VK934_09700 [Fimbriimonas sp.]|nr:hypothetical protein [Fimbriimonas sp.]